MEPTQLTLRTWVKLLKAAALALQQLLKLIENLTFPDEDHDIDPTKDLTRFVSVTLQKTVDSAQIIYFNTDIAEALHAAADRMNTANCPNCKQAREQCRQVITNLLGPDAEKWRTFSDHLDAALDDLTNDGQLNDITDYPHTYRAIAEGILEA